MKMSFGCLVVIAGLLLAFGGCMRNDDEPLLPTRPISRLYISFEDVAQSDTEPPVDNVALIDPADGGTMTIDFNHNSGAAGGAGIHFSPNVGRAFQSGRYDTLVRVMQVNNLGQLANTGRLGNSRLNQMRGVAFHPATQMLYVANTGSTFSHIYGFYQPMNRNGYTVPNRALQLTEGVRPWGMVLWGDSLLVSDAAANGGIQLYGNLSQADSVEVNFPAISTLRIPGALSIRGIAFVDSLDVLVAADYGDPNQNMAGKVYIIQGIKEHLTQPLVTVMPTRVISGPLTGLSGPIDVAIDPRPRADGQRIIYVADAAERPGKVLRFKLSDSGNVAPEAEVTFSAPNRRPFSIFLDARGQVQ
ncbi:hypothetical protein SAMN05421747_102298 [Parapedobacter composti]|uniref:Uncharacterized protein n=1 Tax=Parapedobacter composti TaxID=623281 RepID=A0A1I1F8X9_9SPHI|nr:hypothetical protein [Parapedobacter composti]SFB95406.1 hypothetical protein SAMN05421747_102298 [Parapedobacter composti]